MFGVQSWSLGTLPFRERYVQVVTALVFVSGSATIQYLVALLNNRSFHFVLIIATLATCVALLIVSEYVLCSHTCIFY